MRDFLFHFLNVVSLFFFCYLALYATYLFLSVTIGAWNLYRQERMRSIHNEVKHPYYFPVSILVPAHNEAVTIVDCIQSLLELDYKLYEIIIIDDGSTDATPQVLVNHYQMYAVDRPVRRVVPCADPIAIYESVSEKVKITLIQKKKGGKGDALNMGINASSYPYILCIDADSLLQRDTLERIAQPAMEDETVIAVGGLIRVAQCIQLDDGNVIHYHLPWDLLTSMQVVEYDRAFLASRILMDEFNGNLIISGALGLFRKDVVVAAGGYSTNTIGEDMELAVKLHSFCRSNSIPYKMRYEPNAVCWSQAPSSMKDLKTQRRRWHLGMLQTLLKHRYMFLNRQYGTAGTLSYIYFLLYELFSPLIQIIGWISMILAVWVGILNFPFMVSFYLLYAFYGAILTITAFYQRIYTQNLQVSGEDLLKASVVCLVESIFFRPVLEFVRLTAFIGQRKSGTQWGYIQRHKQKRL